MKTSEGRNDVFAALYQYWRVAPRWVVYDYGCALAVYSFLRETNFFKFVSRVFSSFFSLSLSSPVLLLDNLHSYLSFSLVSLHL